MKKPILSAIILLLISVSTFAQNIVTPVVEQSEDANTTISKIETTNQYTIVSFINTAVGDGVWVQLNKEIFIQTNLGNTHYNYVKSENIAIVPDKHVFQKAGDKLEFKVYFKKIPAAAKSIDIIEHAGLNKLGLSYFNFYNVSLLASKRTKTVDVVLLPPPPVQTDTAMVMPGQNQNQVQFTMDNAMSSMMPMFGNMVKVVMDAQLNYYKQPGKLTEIAKLQKEYFDALVKEGFSYDQAIKIITTESLLPKASAIGGK